MSSFKERFHQLRNRWSAIVWHREELRRVIEMVRDDARLLHAESTYITNMRAWFVDHACAALLGEVEGRDPSAAHTIVDDALANFSEFQRQCSDPTVLDAEALDKAWREVLSMILLPLEWFRAERLLLSNAPARVTHLDLDNAIRALEAFVLRLGRAIEGAASATLLATEQFDWYDVFALPWRPRDEVDMPDFESRIPASTSTREVVIFPWLEIRKPLNSLHITILPRADALSCVETDEGALRARTNYFYDEHRRKLFPSIALLPPEPTESSRHRVERSIHALLFASSAMNAPGNAGYTNSTLLEYFFQRLGGEPEYVARRVRRRYGARIGGSHTALVRAQRPDWCGTGLEPDSELLDALNRVSEDPASDTVFDALRWYYVGSTDADPIPPDIDRIHIRTAIERLLQTSDDERNPSTSEQMKRIRNLTETFTTWRCDTYKGEKRNFHQQALWLLTQDRNVSVHGRLQERNRYAVEDMGVPMDWIFDRLFISLTVAALIYKCTLKDGPKWRALIESFELWLAGCSGTLNDIWSARTILLSHRDWERTPREPLEVNVEYLDPAFVYVAPRASESSE